MFQNGAARARREVWAVGVVFGEAPKRGFAVGVVFGEAPKRGLRGRDGIWGGPEARSERSGWCLGRPRSEVRAVGVVLGEAPKQGRAVGVVFGEAPKRGLNGRDGIWGGPEARSERSPKCRPSGPTSENGSVTPDPAWIAPCVEGPSVEVPFWRRRGNLNVLGRGAFSSSRCPTAEEGMR